VHIHTYIHTSIHTYTHTCRHTYVEYMHACMHTYIQCVAKHAACVLSTHIPKERFRAAHTPRASRPLAAMCAHANVCARAPGPETGRHTHVDSDTSRFAGTSTLDSCANRKESRPRTHENSHTHTTHNTQHTTHNTHKHTQRTHLRARTHTHMYICERTHTDIATRHSLPINTRRSRVNGARRACVRAHRSRLADGGEGKETAERETGATRPHL